MATGNESIGLIGGDPILVHPKPFIIHEEVLDPLSNLVFWFCMGILIWLIVTLLAVGGVLFYEKKKVYDEI
jgi:hypothetical protein